MRHTEFQPHSGRHRTDSWIEPKPAWRPRKEAYLAILPKKPPTSLLVSLADKVDNAEAILNDYRSIGDR